MTRPPDDDPDRPPETRPFDPDEDPAAVGDPDVFPPTGPTDQHPPLGEPGPTSQAYTQPGQPPYPPGPPGPPPDDPYGQAPYQQPGDDGTGAGSGSTGRTVGLVLAAVAALVVIVLVGVMIARSGDSDSGGGAASSTTSASPETSTSESTTSSSTTTTTTTTTEPTTADTVTPGQIRYQLTGGGDVVALSVRADGGPVVVAATGTPWSQTVTATDTALLTAIVVRGSVTCTIMAGGEQLASATSNGGTLTCSARL